MSSSRNAAGLTAAESKKLSQRQPTEAEKGIIKHLNELYKCKAREESYSICAQNSVFHDPIGYAEGLPKVYVLASLVPGTSPYCLHWICSKAQFNGLVKLFDKATIDRQAVLENPSSLPKSTLLVDQDVTYYRKPDSPFKTVNSLLTIEFNGEGKVVKHTEEWNHTPEKTSDDGLLGYLSEGRKKLTANLTDLFVDSKPPSTD